MVSKSSPRVIPSAHVKGSKRGQEGAPLIEGSSPSPPNQPITRKEFVMWGGRIKGIAGCVVVTVYSEYAYCAPHSFVL